MPSGIDHLVIAVPDPDAAAQQLENALGIVATGGGDHPGVGTFNRLAFLADAYLELIGVRDPAAAMRWPVGAATIRALAAGQGFATYALAHDGLEATVLRLGEAGSSIGPVTPGARTRPDGELVEWWTATFPDLGPDRPPFLIRHAYRGIEWGEQAMERRRTFTHRIGTPVSLIALDLAAGDPPAVAATYARELGVRFEPETNGIGTEIGRHHVSLMPGGESQAPAVVHLRGGLSATTVELFGVRFAMTPAG